jgi:AcrR family transcriptional regulator
MLDAALDAFATQGFAGMSVRELARQLGVSHNLIPQRFGSKQRLWYAAVDHGFSALAHELIAVVNDTEGQEDIDRLRAVVVRFVEANAARPALQRIILQEAASPGPRLDHLFGRYIEPVRQFGEAVLTNLYEAGEVRTRSVGLMYFLMTHGVGGALALPALADRFGEPVDSADPEAVHRHAVEAVDVLFEGLRTRTS